MTIVFAAAREDADANRIRVIRAIPIAIGRRQHAFAAFSKKKFQARSSTNPTRFRRREKPRQHAARRFVPLSSRARRACKKSAIHKGFLHSGKVGAELVRGAKYFAALDKKFAASRRASIVLSARVNTSLRRESVFFIAL